MHPTTLTAASLTLIGSDLGPQSTLPAFSPIRALPPAEVGAEADPQMAARVRFGRLDSPLPYARHSDYDRTDRTRTLPSVRLSNGVVTATVLPSLGGRVWSLFDHRRERELLFVNPVLRFANFGLTDAWFAGGIEWNVGSTGHWTLSCRPLHAAAIETPTGTGLRLWEWERTRDLVLQVDLHLDEDRLLASTRVINPDPEPKPLYYWTNIAVPETAGTRVLSGASTAWRTDYSGHLSRVSVPYPDSDGVDISYPATASHAADYFFETAEHGRFVAAVEPDGAGIAQTATDGMRGRKLFLWGTGAGGSRWQEWLCGPGARYAEIQAGWCTTQMEHDVIAGHAEVSWTEAFTGIEVAPDRVSGSFPEAAAATAAVLAARTLDLATVHERWRSQIADSAPVRVLAEGSGWGAAEVALRRGAAMLPEQAVPFPAVQDESMAALVLARGDLGAFQRVPQPAVPPVSDRWRRVYADRRWDGEPWVRYARAVAAHHAGDLATAGQEYAAATASADTSVGAAAVRGQALLAAEHGDQSAATCYRAAVGIDPNNRVLLTEAVTYLLQAGESADALAMLDAAPQHAGHGRLQLLRAQALLAMGDRESAATLLDGLEVPDLAEGGRELTDLWRCVHPDVPVPAGLDFQMTAE